MLSPGAGRGGNFSAPRTREYEMVFSGRSGSTSHITDSLVLTVEPVLAAIELSAGSAVTCDG
jgi:hypothetical protein